MPDSCRYRRRRAGRLRYRPGTSPCRQAPSDAEIVAILKASFKDSPSARLTRLDQSPLQAACTRHRALANRSTTQAARAVAGGRDGLGQIPGRWQYLGDWKRGEAIAQNGRGLQYSDAPGATAGGNCYACHQIDKAEIAHGNIGPTLWNYGQEPRAKRAMLKYTWTRIWNTHAYNACVNMPRFGDAGILTEAQIKDVMALLLDPASPVNQ